MSKLPLVLIATAAALVAGEVLLRTFHPVGYMSPPEPMSGDAWREVLHRHSSVPGLAYELASNKEKYSHGAIVRTNSYGMRDDEPLEESNESVCNIVVLGDSFTFGFGVTGNETYPNVLERLLAMDNTDAVIQVLNFGVGGYSSRDEYLALRYKGMRWNPRLIIVGYFLNDPEIDPLQALHRYYLESKWWQQLNILRLVAALKHRWEIQIHGDGNYYRYLHAQDGEKWKSVLSAFSDIQAVAMEQGTLVLLVIFPATNGKEWSEYPFRDLHSQVADAGKDIGFFVVDLYDTYSKRKSEELMLAPGNPHPSSLGHTLAAVAIKGAIEDNHLLRCM